MPLGPNDLVLSYMAMTRFEPPWTFIHSSWQDRCTAARAGGFAAIGITPDLYDEARAAGQSDDDLKAMLREAGIGVGEVEGLALPVPAERDTAARELDRMLAVAELFSADRVFVTGGPDMPEDDLAEMFGWVCDHCAELGLPVAIEFMTIPGLTTVLPDARSALRIIEAAGRDNGGMVVDLYHHVNGANDWSQLEELPGDSVKGIQFDDTAIPRVVEDYFEDTLHHRRAPGEGDADVVRFVRIMDAIGADCPYSTEVINDEIVALPPVELGERLGSASRRVMQQARG
jgi:sugar phosphate isomerase/epimerase